MHWVFMLVVQAVLVALRLSTVIAWHWGLILLPLEIYSAGWLIDRFFGSS